LFGNAEEEEEDNFMKRSLIRILSGLLLLGLSTTSLLASAAEKPAFDSFMEMFHQQIPFPPEKIIDYLNAKEIPFLATIFPHGRSLERKITDYSNPRVLLQFSVPTESFPFESNEIFIAYTPGNEELQIIARNHETDVFDFKLVTQYGPGKKPLVQNPFSRGLCISCHQNHGPIFPEQPWSESDANDAIASKLKSAPNLIPLASKILFSNSINGNAYGFDAALRDAVIDNQADALCATGCGSDIQCRKEMITAAVGIVWRPGTFDRFFTPTRIKNFQDRLQVSGDSKTMGVPNFRLNDRDSSKIEFLIEPGEGNDPLFPRALNFEHPITARQSLFDQTFAATMIDAASVCFHLSDSLSSTIKDLSEARVQKALASPELDRLVRESWPPTGKQIFDLIKFRKFTKPAKSPHQAASVLEAQKDNRIGLISFPHQDSKQLFVLYCAACHMGASAPAPLLHLQDLQWLKQFEGSAGRTVTHMLEAPNMLMPPAGFGFYPTEREREEMIDALK